MRKQLTQSVASLLKNEEGSSLVTWVLTLALIVGMAVPGVMLFGQGVHAKLCHTVRTIVQATR
jgi:hypothetical protein